MTKEERKIYRVSNQHGLGDVQISDEVIAIIAGIAATEIEGVFSMVGNTSREIISKLGVRNLSKGVKVEVTDNLASLTVALNMKAGASLLETSKKVQEKVKVSIENMTGLTVAEVNVKIVSVEA